jgi:glucose/arabinose dehydrogenase
MPQTSRSALGALPITMGVLLLGGCPPKPDDTPQALHVAPDLTAQFVIANAAYPSVLAPTDDGRIFYTEKNTGQIRVIRDGALLEEPFATVPVNFAGERGVLGLALHPGFNVNGRVYVFYSRSDTGLATDDPQAIVDHRVVYFEATEKGSDVSTNSEVFVVSLPTASALTRIGGRITFDNERRLLVALGDEEQPDDAQDPTSPLGKVLRYNDDGTLPGGNPSPTSPVYAAGFCDPRGLTIDPESGSAFMTERSADTFNEVNRIQAGSNYGWPIVVGFADTPDELDFVAQHSEYGEPVAQMRQALVGAAFNPSGKYGSKLVLQLFYGVSDRKEVFSLPLSIARTASEQRVLFASNLPSAITDVAFTPAGTLYVACANAILRILPSEPL